MMAPLGESKKNFFEIHDTTAADFDSFFLEQLDFFPDGEAFRFPLESTHPPG